MKIIGIGGTNGSGKDTLAEFIAQKYSWLFISVSDLLRDELKTRGLPIERKHLRELSAEWRREFGHGVLVDKAFQSYEKQQSKYQGLVIASLRNPGEAEEIHRLDGIVVWADGDPKIRYQRIYSRGRSAEDSKTFEEFLAEEQAEMHHHKGDSSTLSLGGVKDQADIFITNDSDNLDSFYDQVSVKLKKYL